MTKSVRALIVVATLTIVGGLGTACGSAPPPAATGSPQTTSARTPVPLGIEVGPGTQRTYTVQAQPPTGSCHYSWVGSDPLPDRRCTPGAVNPVVTQADIADTICRSGWTATVRPPEHVTGPEKQGSAAAYGYTGAFATGEYDHLIPLELGGDPNDPANLWLEPNDIAGATSTHNGKDGLEQTLRTLVCAGRIPLVTAQSAIATNWVAAAARYDR